MLLSPEIRNFVASIVALGLLLLFAACYGFTFYVTLFQPYLSSGGSLEDFQFFNNVSTVLAGLVGGVVAVALNVGGIRTSMDDERYFSLIQRMLALAYVIVYISFGVAAAAILIILEVQGAPASEIAPDQLRSLAGIVTGLLVPLASSFFEAEGEY